MAFVLTGGFARVSSFFWHFRRSFKFTAAPIANYVRSRWKVCCHHIAINQPLLFRTRFRMTYCRNTDLISSDEDTFDEIWSESDHLIWHQLDEPALAEVVDERGVHELVLNNHPGCRREEQEHPGVGSLQCWRWKVTLFPLKLYLFEYFWQKDLCQWIS